MDKPKGKAWKAAFASFVAIKEVASYRVSATAQYKHSRVKHRPVCPVKLASLRISTSSQPPPMSGGDANDCKFLQVRSRLLSQGQSPRFITDDHHLRSCVACFFLPSAALSRSSSPSFLTMSSVKQTVLRALTTKTRARSLSTAMRSPLCMHVISKPYFVKWGGPLLHHRAETQNYVNAPHVPKAYDCSVHGRIMYLVTEYIQKSSPQDVMRLHQ